MKILYYIYQICIALPILLVLTILTAIVTIIGSLLGGVCFRYRQEGISEKYDDQLQAGLAG